VIAADAVRRQRSRLLDLVSRAGSVVAAAWVVSFLVEGAAVGWGRAAWLRLLVASDPGRRALLGVVLAVATWWLVRLLRPATVTAPVDRLLAAMAAVVVVVGAYGGHSAIGGNQWLGVALRLTHFGAIALWVGSVAVAWWCVRNESSPAAVWRAASRVAGWAVAVTGLSGFVLSGRTVDTVTALLRTQYGFVVLVKVGCLVVAALVGGLAARDMGRGRQPRVVVELAVASIAIFAAAVLGGSAPAVGAQFAAPASMSPQVATGDLADLTVSVGVSPARVGANLVQAEVLNTRRPEPGVIRSMRVRLVHQGRVIVDHVVQQPTGPVEWSDDQLSAAGGYRVIVDIDRPDAPVPAFERSFTVSPLPVRPVPTRVSRRPWMPLAALFGGVWAIVVLAVARRRPSAAR
jgi:putative copper export protein